MLSTTTSTIGIFDNHQKALQAISALKDNGFTDKQIGIASKEYAQQFANVSSDEQKVAEGGAVAGAAVGGGVGATLGLIGALLVPGLLPLVAGPTLVAALLGGAAGAAGGAFAGPFIALGFSEHEAEKHVELVKAGKTVVVVYDPDRLQEAERIMVAHGAYDASMANSP